MSVLQRFRWVKNLDPILKTKVPILKLEVDPIMDYNCLVDSNDAELIGMYGVNESVGDDLNLKENKLGLESMSIKVDISVDLLNNIF